MSGNKGYYRIHTAAVPDLIYGATGSGTFAFLGELYNGYSYFFCTADTFNLPTHPYDSLQKITMDDQLATALRQVAPGGAQEYIRILEEVKLGAAIELDKLQKLRTAASFLWISPVNSAVQLTPRMDAIKPMLDICALNIAATQMLAGILPSSPLPFMGAETQAFMLTPQEVVSLAIACLQFAANEYQWAWEKQAMITAATTVDEVDEIVRQANQE